MNPMRDIMVEKVTLNIGVGAPGDKLDKAMKLLTNITGLKAVQTSSNKRIPTWGVRPKLAIACKVTVRGKKADELLGRLLQALDNKLLLRKFDRSGNLSFGIQEYIDIPNVSYDPSIGVIGLEAAITLKRPGYRVKIRSLKSRKIGSKHLIKRDEAVDFIKKKYSVDIMEEE